MTESHTLTAENLELGYGGRTVVESLDLAVPPGKITTIVGANACGKSTLLRSMSRLLSPRSGHVLLDGKDVHRLPAKKLARTLGLLPQSPIAPEGIVVADLVGRGRHPHQRVLSRWSREDDAAVAEALAATDTTGLAERSVDELSGGQRQRVWIAMALAQQTDLLLLDEPTTFLDVSHQVEVLDLLTDLNRTRGTTIVMVLHDLNLAARYADYLVAMADRGFGVDIDRCHRVVGEFATFGVDQGLIGSEVSLGLVGSVRDLDVNEYELTLSLLLQVGIVADRREAGLDTRHDETELSVSHFLADSGIRRLRFLGSFGRGNCGHGGTVGRGLRGCGGRGGFFLVFVPAASGDRDNHEERHDASDDPWPLLLFRR